MNQKGKISNVQYTLENNVRVVSSALWGSFFIMFPQRIVRNEPNLDCFQHMFDRSDDENVGSFFCISYCS